MKKEVTVIHGYDRSGRFTNNEMCILHKDGKVYVVDLTLPRWMIFDEDNYWKEYAIEDKIEDRDDNWKLKYNSVAYLADWEGVHGVKDTWLKDVFDNVPNLERKVKMLVGAYDLLGWTEQEYILHKNGKVYVLGEYNQDWSIEDEEEYNENGRLEDELYEAEYVEVSLSDLSRIGDNMGRDGLKAQWLKDVFDL